MVGHLEEKVLLGICNGSEIPGTDAIQYKIVAASHDILSAIYKSFSIFGDNTFWNESVPHTWFHFFPFIRFVDSSIYSIRCNCYGKEQRAYITKNSIFAGNLAYCAGICLCVRHVSWFLQGAGRINKAFMERKTKHRRRREKILI